jgi:nitrile hydratase
MNGIHDMGGMQDMGPVHAERDEPVFHAPWERRMFALFNATDIPWPLIRTQIELIPPADYLRMSYYEKWLAAFVPLVTQAGVVTAAEVQSGKPLDASTRKWRVLRAAEVANWIVPDSRAGEKQHVASRFQVGQRVRARLLNPTGHTRLPRYIRGKNGIVTADRGIELNQDALAQGLGKKPQHVYAVRFSAREVWGAQANERDSIYLDLWDDHLEPAHADT